MEHVYRHVFVVSITALFCASALAQTAAPPPSGAIDNGTPLAVTMQYIQGKLNDIGTVNFVTYVQNTTENSSFSNIYRIEVGHVVADPSQCRVTYHWKILRDSSTLMDDDFSFLLQDVQDIVIEPYSKYQNEVDASLGNPNFVTSSTNPRITALVARHSQGTSNLFPFTDADTAGRVAKAFTHAVDLCGGGNKNPY